MVNRYDPQTLDDLLDAVGTARRRYALYYAREHGEVDVADVTETVADWLTARTRPGGGLPRDTSRKRTSLHHVDLPKLAEGDLISFDRQAGTVTFEGSGIQDTLLDVLFEHERIPESTSNDDSTYRGV